MSAREKRLKLVDEHDAGRDPLGLIEDPHDALLGRPDLAAHDVRQLHVDQIHAQMSGEHAGQKSLTGTYGGIMNIQSSKHEKITLYG